MLSCRHQRHIVCPAAPVVRRSLLPRAVRQDPEPPLRQFGQRLLRSVRRLQHAPASVPAAGRNSARPRVTTSSNQGRRAVSWLMRNRRFLIRDWAGLHKPVGVILLPAYTLGAAASVLGLHAPLWLPVLTGTAIGSAFAFLNRWGNVRLWLRPRSPLNVVVTGGSRGLGKALARELLREGDRVLITSRTPEGLATALSELRDEVGRTSPAAAALCGAVVDVSHAGSVAELQVEALRQLGGRVDVWLNNAALSGSFQAFEETSPEALQAVVRTNLLGSLICSRQAARLLRRQPEGGHIFNMDGAGADGLATPNYAAYGATKAGIAHLSSSLAEELEGTAVRVHTLSPGMILTDLLLEGATSRNKQMFNILCEHPETVAAFLVPRIKSIVARGERNAYVAFLTPVGALWRLLTAPWRLNRFFDSDGDAVYPEERERISGKHAKATARAAAGARRRDRALQLAYSLSTAICVAAIILDAHGGAALAGS